LAAVKKGDFSARMPLDWTGIDGKIADTLNDIIELNDKTSRGLYRVSKAVGKEGKLAERMSLGSVDGAWAHHIESVNALISDLGRPTTEMARVIGAVAKGDLTQRMVMEADDKPIQGEFMRTAKIVNTMVDQLGAFAGEVTRVAREVGSEGKLGGQAQVVGVAGIWNDLTVNVNLMAANLTDQVRAIAVITAAVVSGDLSKKITVDAKGELLALKNTVNTMVDQLGAFAGEVTRVAREVGTEGKLGGQAKVVGVAGIWNDLTDNINAMIRSLKDTTDKNTEQDWLKTNLARFTRLLQGQREMLTVCKLILSELAPLVKAQHGVFYGMEGEKDDARLALQASYAYKERNNLPKQFGLGEGLVGECALQKERILLTNVPSDYVQINSGLGGATPLNVVVLPVMFEGVTKAVIELASFERFSPTHLAFLEQLTESIGVVLNTIEANSRTEALLLQSQNMAGELQTQQAKLQQSNEALEEKAQLLIGQNTEVERKNREVEIAKQSLEEKAAQLSLSSKYKSEFLANMSHELRTPLNSLLLLSQQLRDNPEQNLSDKQVEYAGTIFASGNDLLNLINDILDLSKIESGTVTADIDEVAFAELHSFVEQTFRHIAEDKKLGFAVDLENTLPSSIFTDERRVKQIIKNLLSNAFKFTPLGQVALKIGSATEGWSRDHPTLSKAATVVAFAVSDSGIGIPQDKQRVIFEAFQQADGTTIRTYGGTGLGLAISRELAHLLGGEITLKSVPGEGSVFILYLPLHYAAPAKSNAPFAADGGDAPSPGLGSGRRGSIGGVRSPTASNRATGPEDGGMPGTDGAATELRPVAIVTEKLNDDRTSIQPGDRVMLIVEDDPHFARILRDFAHERGFKALLAMQGQTALALAKQYRPDAITLDMQLPDTSGWAILDLLKHDSTTRHIPVHIISVEEGEDERGRKLGALACTPKPVDKEALSQAFIRMEDFLARKVKNLLVVEDDPAERDRIVELIGHGDVQITTAANGSDALAALKQTHFDCLVLDLGLPDTTGYEVIEKIKKDPSLRALPIIVYTARELTQEENNRIKKAGKSVIVKDVRSPERLLDEVTLFLHRVEDDLPESKRKILEQVRKTDPLLAGKKVLIVDDDVRNIFSLTAVLERHRMQVLSAENGKDAIDLLKKTPDVEIVLMDVMMPEMDGYEAMRAIRKLPQFKSLPIISLTAKVMKGDREKCIEAGASDYIPKPVNTEQLLSLLRVWLNR
jgi:CheY-like chemotaxis protein/HAMP domain-containing protein